MSAEHEPPRRAAAVHSGAPPSQRDLCVWLGTLASWRGGLVGRLVREYGDVDAVLERPVAELRASLRIPVRRSSAAGPGAKEPGEAARAAADGVAERRRYDAVLEAPPPPCTAGLSPPGRLLVPYCDARYPQALKHLTDPPLCVFVAAASNDIELTRRLKALGEAPVVAVVGTRSPSPYGAEMAAILGRDLALRGIVVVSGLAMGVDAAAQAAALRAGGAAGGLTTVAVMGCGADVAYPSCNARLHREVLRHGLVVSEFAWGVPARAWRFPARNRIMAALSQAVVIVEGAARSGARITVDFALDLGAEVLAVPGEAGKKLTQAPHKLLREGAALCESVDDVVAALAGERRGTAEPDRGPHPGPASSLLTGRAEGNRLLTVLDALERAPLTADQVAESCGLRVQTAAAILSELEIEGLVSPAGAGTYRRRRL